MAKAALFAEQEAVDVVPVEQRLYHLDGAELGGQVERVQLLLVLHERQLSLVVVVGQVRVQRFEQLQRHLDADFLLRQRGQRVQDGVAAAVLLEDVGAVLQQQRHHVERAAHHGDAQRQLELEPPVRVHLGAAAGYEVQHRLAQLLRPMLDVLQHDGAAERVTLAHVVNRCCDGEETRFVVVQAAQ